MSKLVAIAFAASLSVAVPVKSYAQAKTQAVTEKALPIDGWISDPTAIQLTGSQRKAFDSLRVAYQKDLDKTRAESKTIGFKEAVGLRAKLDSRYQHMLREILTPDQVKILNANTHTRGTR